MPCEWGVENIAQKRGKAMKHLPAGLTVLLTGLMLLSLPHPAAAQAGQPFGMLEVNVQVDGLSCPFCAYGLEKKLRKVGNVDSLEILVSEGRAVLSPKPGTSLDLAAVERAVRDGGFTPRSLTLIARGRLNERQGTPALELSNGIVLLLAEGGQTDALRESGNGSVVRVEGQAVQEQADGRPYTLRVSSFQDVS